MSVVVGMSSSSLAGSLGLGKSTQNLSRKEDSKRVEEKAFSSLLKDTVCESITDTLGKNVLSILVSKGLLDNADNPGELERQLSSTFGNGSVVLERIIVKGLYQKLRIPFDSTFGFDYAKALDIARSALFGEIRRK
jgi:hypothetical protein